MRPQVTEQLDPLAGQLAAHLLEGEEQAQVGAVLRLGREQVEHRIQDVPDRAGGVALDVRQQMLGLAVLLALGVDRGVEVLLGSGVLYRGDPPLAGAPVNGRDLQALIGEPL
jgi:hypothetical protein